MQSIRPKFFFSNLPADTSLKRLVATAKSGGRIEHSYRELKDELGLDHFEGRSWRGWQHHIVLVLAAYAFLQHLRRARKKGGSTASLSLGCANNSKVLLACWCGRCLLCDSDITEFAQFAEKPP